MLHFEYCECGCHGLESEPVGGRYFWIYIASTQDKAYLHLGHGRLAPLVRECKTYEEAVQVASEKMRVILEEEQNRLNEVRRQLDEKPLTFEQELREQFSGNENVEMIKLIRTCKSSNQIMALAQSFPFTEIAKSKLEEVAKAFDRTDKACKKQQ